MTAEAVVWCFGIRIETNMKITNMHEGGFLRGKSRAPGLMFERDSLSRNLVFFLNQ